MKNPGDKRMYLIERNPRSAIPRVTPVWGRRDAGGIVTFTKFRASTRQWVMPDEAFETELQAWQQIAKLTEAAVAEAQRTVAVAQKVQVQVERRIKRLTRKSPRRRRE